MKILLVLPPTAELPGYAEPPAGLLYVASALKRAGHEPQILDIFSNYISPEDLTQYIEKNKFEAIGYGGITTCYGYIKEASTLIRNRLPKVHQMAGGVISSAYELLLNNTPIDVICLKEGEVTAVNIAERFANNSREFNDVKGVVYKEDGKIIKTPPQPYIENLDQIPFPDYDLINMDLYAFDAMDDYFFSNDKSSLEFYKKGMRVFNLKTARGCTNSCAFCYRHFYGFRQNSIEYVISHIKYLQTKYNIHYFRFGDELFTRDKDWVIRFARKLIEENILIRYIVHGVRTDNVDDELIKSLKDSGCIALFVGFESGSQTILNEMKKNVTVEQNINAVQIILRNKMNVLVQIVLSMPSEAPETINETIKSILETGISDEWVAIGYAQAYPGTWLWQYAIKNELIKDQEDYLISIGKSNKYLINYTKFPFIITSKWSWRILHAIALKNYHDKPNLINYLKTLDYRIYSFVVVAKRKGIFYAIKKSMQYIFRG